MPHHAEKIRVALVEDDDALRTSLAQFIDGTKGFACVGSYGDAESVLAGLRRRPADVLVLDLGLPGMEGEELLARLDRFRSRMKVLVLTVHDETERIFRALLAGASGYWVKPVPPVQFLEAIQELHGGGSPMSPSVARRVIDWLHLQGRQQKDLETLSAREMQVLRLIAEGLTNGRIGERLGISPRTVGTHVQHIYDKLHVRTRAAAAARLGTRWGPF